MTQREKNRLLEELILRLTAEGKSVQEIVQAVTEFMANNGFVDNDVIETRKKQAETIVRSSAPPSLRSATSALYERMLSGVADAKGKTVQDLQYELTQSLKQGVNSKDILDRVKKTLQTSEDRARTVVETATRGFDRASTIVAFQKSGITHFVYDGTSTNVRPFCEDLLKRTARGESWTLEQIEKMDNGQGLNVLISCGGWNCRHRWKPKV